MSCCADIVKRKIISEIKHSKYFSILADEVADCSNKEQMPIVLRYVDSDSTIKERFLEFVHCNTGTTSQALYDKILIVW